MQKKSSTYLHTHTRQLCTRIAKTDLHTSTSKTFPTVSYNPWQRQPVIRISLKNTAPLNSSKFGNKTQNNTWFTGLRLKMMAVILIPSFQISKLVSWDRGQSTPLGAGHAGSQYFQHCWGGYCIALHPSDGLCNPSQEGKVWQPRVGSNTPAQVQIQTLSSLYSEV